MDDSLPGNLASGATEAAVSRQAGAKRGRLAGGRIGRFLAPRVALQLVFVLVSLAILYSPMVLQVVGRSGPRSGENRPPAASPESPRSIADLPRWTAAVDAYLKDRFGLRNQLVDLHDRLLFYVFNTFNSGQILAGHDGRLFLTSHSADEASRNSLIQESCGFGIAAGQWDTVAHGFAEVLARTAGPGPDTRIVLVPSSAALYRDQLPSWLQRQCALGTRPAVGIAARLPEGVRPRFIDLFPIMEQVNREAPAIPRRNFHWDGLGPLRSAEWLSETILGRRRAFSLPGRTVSKPSDLSGFFPGIRLQNDVFEPDYAAAGVTPCYGPACFPGLGETARVLQSLQKFTGPAPDGRLLLITDSYGDYAAGSFVEYFQEVWQVSINNLLLLGPEQRARLRQEIFDGYRPDKVLLLFHDRNGFYLWDWLLRGIYPWGTP
jgi:hypothetical protein